MKIRTSPSPEEVQISPLIGFYEPFFSILRPSASKIIAENFILTLHYINVNHVPAAVAFSASRYGNPHHGNGIRRNLAAILHLRGRCGAGLQQGREQGGWRSWNAEDGESAAAVSGQLPCDPLRCKGKKFIYFRFFINSV